MKHKLRVRRKWLVAAFMLLSAVALSSANATTGDQCDQCGADCWRQAQQAYDECIASSSFQDCYFKKQQYNKTCKLFFCDYGGLCP